MEPHSRALVAQAQETLKQLKNEGYLLGLATSIGAGSGEAILKKLEIFEYFDACTYGSEVSYGKPDPEIYLLTAEKLDVKPRECIVIEDSEDCFRGAKDAGMGLIARRAGHNRNNNFSLADRVVENLLDVPELARELCVRTD